jgi:hypothetical protein
MSTTHEFRLDTVEVWGSSPHGPIIYFNNLRFGAAAGSGFVSLFVP